MENRNERRQMRNCWKEKREVTCKGGLSHGDEYESAEPEPSAWRECGVAETLRGICAEPLAFRAFVPRLYGDTGITKRSLNLRSALFRHQSAR